MVHDKEGLMVRIELRELTRDFKTGPTILPGQPSYRAVAKKEENVRDRVVACKRDPHPCCLCKREKPLVKRKSDRARKGKQSNSPLRGSSRLLLMTRSQTGPLGL